MESLGFLDYNPHIHMVLRTFQDAATDSLKGPSRYISSWNETSKMSALEFEDHKKEIYQWMKHMKGDVDIKQNNTPIFPAQMPFFFAMDTSRSEKSETTLEGETIACFVVGGEKRLCLPQILNTLLRPFSMEQVYDACNELHIFFSRCNPEQLHILKAHSILPDSAPNCGLITKTDAERLCHKLLYSAPEKSGVNPPSPNSFKVYHECFGKCKGVFNPELYSHPNAKCIQCCDCEGMFSPSHFVCHSHNSLENRTCHWGFDSANWRTYMLLAKNQSHMSKLESCLDEMKQKFELKRKEISGIKNAGKKVKYDDPPSESVFPDQTLLQQWKTGESNDYPTFLHRGTPVILNPEKVVPFTSTKKESGTENFAPNVSLAPVCQQKEQSEENDVSGQEPVGLEKLEINVSAEDSEHVSDNSDSGVSTPTEKACVSLNVYLSEREQELQMLREALDGKVVNSEKAKEAFIEDFMRLRIREDIKLKQLESAKQTLRQELDFVRYSKRQTIRELTESKRALKKEVDRLRAEGEIKARELEQLSNGSEAGSSLSKNTNLKKLKTHYKQEIEVLKTQLKKYAEVHREMSSELKSLREQLESFGKHVPHIKYEVESVEPTDCPPDVAMSPVSAADEQPKEDQSQLVDSLSIKKEIEKDELVEESSILPIIISPKHEDVITPT